MTFSQYRQRKAECRCETRVQVYVSKFNIHCRSWRPLESGVSLLSKSHRCVRQWILDFEVKSPAFQFYPDDFVGGTVVFTTEETGAYIRLLCYQWGNGKIPSEKSVLERIAGGPVSEAVLAKFKNGKQPRLEAERKKQREYREKQRINGAKGGRPQKPKPNPSLSSGFVETEPKKSSPSPISVSYLHNTGERTLPTKENAKTWLADWIKNGATYTFLEMDSAFNALAASGWIWGRNPVTDFRAALERQIQTDRDRKPKKAASNNGREDSCL